MCDVAAQDRQKTDLWLERDLEKLASLRSVA